MEASRNRLMAIIKTQSEIAASDLDTNRVMHLVANSAQEITGATSAVIELPEGDEMVYAVTSGEATPYRGIRMDRRSTLSGLALDRDQVLFCEDTEIDPRIDRRASRRVNLRSMICVPLKHQGKAVGVLKVYSPEPRHFGPADVETLNLLSDAISAHLAHASLFELAAKEGRTDALTGLFNRRAYEERRVVEAARSARFSISGVTASSSVR
jgi:GAF domain-containing protein